MLAPFDNSAFLNGLRDRGFYIPDEATSNYEKTEASIPSSLNMSYLEGFEKLGDAEKRKGQELTKDPLVARILIGLGYRYVQLVTGFPTTGSSIRADLVVDFGPSGPIVIRNRGGPPGDSKTPQPVPNRFPQEFAQTTLLQPFLDTIINADERAPYSWPHPARTLATFQFLKTVPDIEGPTFTFAHIIKPHHPFNFDRNGNISPYLFPGFSDDHDPSVPSAYIGQLLYVNQLVLDTVDAILRESAEPPIIVLSSDHGTGHGPGPDPRHAIFAAYLLPGGGDAALYPSISSVNSFRVVFDHYFNLGLGLLEDRAIFFAVDSMESANPAPDRPSTAGQVQRKDDRQVGG